ncbi:MAG: tetratricopeptide repeat protein, partial [Rhodanobacteraceae bacterium]
MPNIPAAIIQQLQTATRMMQAGMFVQARPLLEQILCADPDLVQARWLLGGALLNCGDFTGAERAALAAIHLNPDTAALHALLGDALASQNRMQQAESALRHALVLDPRHVPAITSLAKVLLASGRAEDARSVIEECTSSVKATPELLLLRAQALLAGSKFSEAVSAYQQAIDAAPGNASAEIGLAVALGDSGQHVAAEAAVRGAMAKGLDTPESHFVLARSLLRMDRFDEAEAEFHRALHLRPDYFAAHTNLAEMIWMRTGNAEAASLELDATLHANPDLKTLRTLKAKLLEAAGDPQGALAELDAGLALSGDSAELHIAAAQTALKCDASRALKHAEHALKLLPETPLTLSTYGNALLASGRAEHAEALAAKILAVNPDDGLAIALQATAWRMLGDPRYRRLYDYEKFVRPGVIDTPEGWPNLPSYLDDLARELRQRHSLHTHPIGQSLRHGTQVDLVMERSQPAIRAFAQAIDGPIRRYMDAIGKGRDVLRRRNTGRYTLQGIWSVRLRSSGYHFNHFHPEGWLSSACYIQLPPAIGANGKEGWLQFGGPGFPTPPPLPPEH